jgi:hypothetical protein
MRILILLLSALISSPALAQARHHADPPDETAPHYRTDVVRHPRITRDPADVVFGGKVIGRDPDPWIRQEILRHAESGWPD